jgi:hypothetical protein
MGDVRHQPMSISVSELSEKAKDAVAKALEAHTDIFSRKPEHYRIGFVPQWWIGVVIESPEMERTPLVEVQRLAVEMHMRILGAIPDAAAGGPGFAWHHGNLIMGFIRNEKIDLIEN